MGAIKGGWGFGCYAPLRDLVCDRRRARREDAMRRARRGCAAQRRVQIVLEGRRKVL